MNRIIISVTNDLVTDQRVIRTCECLNELGFEILLVGRKLKNSLDVNLPYDYQRFQLFFNKGFLFYAEFNLRLFFKLLMTRKKFLYANDLDTLLPNFLVSRLTSSKLIYDSHEYFTEVPELISRPGTKKFWSAMEGYIFPKLKNVLTVNHKIAELYKKKYRTDISVIRNVPSATLHNEHHDLHEFGTGAKIILYQGALNKGRGLELMIDAMELLEGYRLVIVGDGDLSKILRQRVSEKSLNEKIIFLGKISPDRLVHLTKQADIGLSLEEPLGLNYLYCLPNKLFDYIRAGIPVLVSDLPLLTGVLKDYNIGEILTDRNPHSLAEAIAYIVSNKKNYKKGLQVAASEFNWEKEKTKLIQFINSIE